jgi:hypothetical protein
VVLLQLVENLPFMEEEFLWLAEEVCPDALVHTADNKKTLFSGRFLTKGTNREKIYFIMHIVFMGRLLHTTISSKNGPNANCSNL